MLNNKVRIFKENVQVSGYNLPADFFIPTQSFLNEISTLNDNEKLIKLYENISGEKVNVDVKNRILNIENLLEILCLDDQIFTVDLTQNDTLSYKSLIIDNSTIYREICSLVSLYYLVYLNLYDGYFNSEETVNFILPYESKVACISALIFKKFIKNLKFIIAGDNTNDEIHKKGFYKPCFNKVLSQNFISEFFEDYGYVFDANSSKEIFAYESFLENLDDTSNAVFFAFSSPYLTCQESYGEITGKTINNQSLLIKKFYEETVLEIPQILTKKGIRVDFNDCITNDTFLYLINNLL